MTPVDYSRLLLLLAPEMILVITALAVLAADLIWARDLKDRNRHTIAFSITLFGSLAAVASLMMGTPDPAGATQWLTLGGATTTVKIGLIALTLSALAISTRSPLTSHIGELYLLTLLATVGMLFMASANHLLLAFIALELVSLSFYILVALYRHHKPAAEGALRYFLLGGVSAGFTLFGLSFIYGATGSMAFDQISQQLDGSPPSPLLIVGMVALVIGFGFKIAAVPMHLWAPDAYQAAAPPVGALIASASKLASFYLFARIWTVVLADVAGRGADSSLSAGWLILLAILAAASLILGNVAAIAQTSLKRLLAYSAIAHAGYILIGLMGEQADGIAAVIYYLVTYGLAIVGAFALVLLVEGSDGSDQITAFAGFHRRYPLESFCLLIFILSLAGIPPLAGFFGKFYLFAAALKSGLASNLLFALVVLAVAMSAVSLYYYLKVLKQAYVVPSPNTARRRSDPVLRVVVILMAIGVVALGCFPDILVGDLVADLK